MKLGIVSLVLAYVLSQFYRAFLAVLAPVLETDLGATAEHLANASGIWFLIFAAMQIPLGAALDRIGKFYDIERDIIGERLLGLGVDLGEGDVRVLLRRRFVDRAECLARAAPFGPEIKDHDIGHRRFDNILAETVDRFLLVEAEAHACQG